MASFQSIFDRFIHRAPTQPIAIVSQAAQAEKLNATLRTLRAERSHLLQWMNAGAGCPNDTGRLEELNAKITENEEELYTVTMPPPIPATAEK